MLFVVFKPFFLISICGYTEIKKKYCVHVSDERPYIINYNPDALCIMAHNEIIEKNPLCCRFNENIN